jgi:phytoene synthase
MAWWRERLDELDGGTAAPAEPRLRAVASQLVARGIRGDELSRLEDGWLPLLEPFPWGAGQAAGLRLRGEVLFGIGARLLGGAGDDAKDAGSLWSLVDGAVHCSDPQSRAFLCDAARTFLPEVPRRTPRALRPLTILAALAAYDLRPGGRVGRVGAAMRHRLSGIIPRG